MRVRVEPVAAEHRVDQGEGSAQAVSSGSSSTNIARAAGRRANATGVCERRRRTGSGALVTKAPPEGRGNSPEGFLARRGAYGPSAPSGSIQEHPQECNLQLRTTSVSGVESVSGVPTRTTDNSRVRT